MWVALPTFSKRQKKQVANFLKFLVDKGYFYNCKLKGAICKITILLDRNCKDVRINKNLEKSEGYINE